MATDPKPRVFLDTNVLYSALHSPLGNPARILRLYADRRVQVVVSSQVLSELVRSVKSKVPTRLADVRELIESGAFETAVNPQHDAVGEAETAGVNRDDAPIVAAALDSDVQYFVTGDRRLLTEIKNIDPPFRALSPRQFLEEISDD